jgi:arginyl-tRNA synthetase
MLRHQIADIVVRAIASLQESGALPAVELPPIEITRPQIAAHGDYATNVAMKLAAAMKARGEKANPRQVGEQIAAQIRETVAVVPAYDLVSAVEVAGPGFINLRLSPQWLLRQAREVVAAGNTLGVVHAGRGVKVNLEFVSANPTGPVTIGNGRGAFIGDTLGNAMRAAEFDVTKEYYFNDAGEQVTKLGRSMEYYLYLALGEKAEAERALAALPVAQKFKRAKDYYKAKGAPDATAEAEAQGGEAAEGEARAVDAEEAERDQGESDRMEPEHAGGEGAAGGGNAGAIALGDANARKEGYFGEFYETVAARMLEEGGRELLRLPAEERPQAIGHAAAQVVMRDIQATMAKLHVEFDVFFNEASLKESGALQESIQVLRDLGFVKQEEGALWAKTSLFGDDRDRVVLRSNGLPTYFASDVAYMRDKFDRGFDRLIFVLGPDHHGYVARLKAIAGVLGRNPDDVHILIYGQVSIKQDGKSVRMGKRLGNVVTLDELYEDVGADVTRFFYLMRANETPLDFDLALARKQTDENPGLSVQYAHARASGVFRKAEEQGITQEEWERADTGVLAGDPEGERAHELNLMRELLRLEEVVERAALSLEPHHLTRYAMDLADAFHLFYDHCPILKAGANVSPAVRDARFVLLRAAQAGLARTLTLIGMTAPERMDREETPSPATPA